MRKASEHILRAFWIYSWNNKNQTSGIRPFWISNCHVVVTDWVRTLNIYYFVDFDFKCIHTFPSSFGTPLRLVQRDLFQMLYHSKCFYFLFIYFSMLLPSMDTSWSFMLFNKTEMNALRFNVKYNKQWFEPRRPIPLQHYNRYPFAFLWKLI